MPNPIEDEFRDLKISRQRKYQLRMRRQGRCVVCGDKAAGSNLCLKHLVAERERRRKKLGSTRRLTGTKSYRLQEEFARRAKRRQSERPEASKKAKA
jgi:hypothetical protein